LNAATVIKEAAGHGIKLWLDGEKPKIAAKAKPSEYLLGNIRIHKAEIVALLRQAALAVRPKGYSDAEWLGAVADAKRLGYPPTSRRAGAVS
jgi:hypothetical protein